MLATNWQSFGDVWSEMNRLNDEMNRVFDQYGYGDARGRKGATFPALDLWQDDDNLYVEAELPGMELDDLEIYVSGENQLGIKGARKTPDQNGATWHRRERKYGTFARAISLPCPVSADDVSAGMKHGVLTVTLPKAQVMKPRRIEVKAD